MENQNDNPQENEHTFTSLKNSHLIWPNIKARQSWASVREELTWLLIIIIIMLILDISNQMILILIPYFCVMKLNGFILIYVGFFSLDPTENNGLI